MNSTSPHVAARPQHRSVHHPQHRGGVLLSDRVVVMSSRPGRIATDDL
jgi:hypothetical protein